MRTFPAALAVVGTAVLLTACSGGSSGGSTPAPTGDSSGVVSEESKGKSCEEYRDLSEQVEKVSAQAQDLTVTSAEDGEKITELMTKVSDLTAKADAAYALCYADGVAPSTSAGQ